MIFQIQVKIDLIQTSIDQNKNDQVIDQVTSTVNAMKKDFQVRIRIGTYLSHKIINVNQFAIQMQDQIDQIKDANQRVIFSAIRNRRHVNRMGTITYDEANVNLGGGMDIGTGKYTVPVSGYRYISGIYSFSFRGMTKYEGDRTAIQVNKNDAFQFFISENSKGRKSYDILSTPWTMNLKQNDVISLYSYTGGFHVSSRNPIFFNGHLLMKQ